MLVLRLVHHLNVVSNDPGLDAERQEVCMRPEIEPDGLHDSGVVHDGHPIAGLSA